MHAHACSHMNACTCMSPGTCRAVPIASPLPYSSARFVSVLSHSCFSNDRADCGLPSGSKPICMHASMPTCKRFKQVVPHAQIMWPSLWPGALPQAGQPTNAPEGINASAAFFTSTSGEQGYAGFPPAAGQISGQPAAPVIPPSSGSASFGLSPLIDKHRQQGSQQTYSQPIGPSTTGYGGQPSQQTFSQPIGPSTTGYGGQHSQQSQVIILNAYCFRSIARSMLACNPFHFSSSSSSAATTVLIYVYL